MTRQMVALASLLACGILDGSSVRAAEIPATDPRDLSGVWELPEGVSRAFSGGRPYEQKPPFKPLWADEWSKIVTRVRAGMRVWDPSIRCIPPGMPRTMGLSYPMEILQTPGRTTIITEFFNEIRKIYMDGRSHPPADEIEPTFSGHSIAHWEGDTLVIDTVGLRYETVADLSMIPKSDQMHIVERVRRAQPDELEWTITLNDPVVFEKPWTSVKRYVRSPAGTDIREYVCADGNKPDPYEPSPEDEKYMQPDPRLKTLP